MSEALKTWRKKLDYLHQQEATVSDPAQKFTLAQQIEEAKAKIAELELATENSSASGGVASSRKVFPTKFTIILPIVLVLLGILAVASFVAFPKKKPDPEIAALKTSVEEMQKRLPQPLDPKQIELGSKSTVLHTVCARLCAAFCLTKQLQRTQPLGLCPWRNPDLCFK